MNHAQAAGLAWTVYNRTRHSWNVFHHWTRRHNFDDVVLHGAICLFVVWIFLTQAPLLLLIAGRAVFDAVSIGTWIYRTVFEREERNRP